MLVPILNTVTKGKKKGKQNKIKPPKSTLTNFEENFQNAIPVYNINETNYFWMTKTFYLRIIFKWT